MGTQQLISARPGTVLRRNGRHLTVLHNDTLRRILTVRAPDRSTARLRYPPGAALELISRPYYRRSADR